MKYITTSIILLFLTSCIEPREAKNKSNVVEAMGATVTKQFPSVDHISIEDFLKLDPSKYVLVDVRSPNEVKTSMIPGAITKEAFEKNSSNYSNKTVISYCTIGYRSSKYSLSLQKRGFKVANLKESILGWAMRKKPLKDVNGPTKKVHVYTDAWDFLPEGYTGVYK